MLDHRTVATVGGDRSFHSMISFMGTVTYVPRESMATPSSGVYTVTVRRLRCAYQPAERS
jgi:hypothetical protein